MKLTDGWKLALVLLAGGLAGGGTAAATTGERLAALEADNRGTQARLTRIEDKLDRQNETLAQIGAALARLERK